jgi:hypothetical protein
MSMKYVRHYPGSVMKTRTDKCPKCGAKKYTEICPGCGKDMPCGSVRVDINIRTQKRSIYLRAHSLRCLKKALGKEEYDAVLLLLNAKGSRSYGPRKRSPASLRRIIKRSERIRERARKELKDAAKKE